MLAAEGNARAVAAELAGAPRAVLRLGTSDGLGEHLSRVLAALRQAAPDLAVELVSAPTQTRLDRVRAGQLEAAFVRGVEHSPDLRLIRVWWDPLLVALPATHPLAERPEVDLAELAGLPLRLTTRRSNPPLVDLVFAACQQAGFAPLAGPAFTTMQDALAAIGAGPPSWMVVFAANARLLSLPQVAFRPVSGGGLGLPTMLAVGPGHPSAGLDALLRACRTSADPAGGTDHDR